MAVSTLYCPPYTYPLGRQAGTSIGWNLYGKDLRITPITELLSQDPYFMQMVQPSTTCTLISNNASPASEGVEEIIITYITGQGVKKIQSGTLLADAGTVTLTDADSFKYIESIRSVTTCSGAVQVRPGGATIEPVTYLPAFDHGAITFHRFPGTLTSYLTRWSARLEVSLVASEPVYIELRWYQNQDDCNCYDGPYEIIDSAYLFHSGAAATYVSAEYNREFHPTQMLAPGGWFGVFGETATIDAFASVNIQGYDILPIKVT